MAELQKNLSLKPSAKKLIQQHIIALQNLQKLQKQLEGMKLYQDKCKGKPIKDLKPQFIDKLKYYGAQPRQVQQLISLHQILKHSVVQTSTFGLRSNPQVEKFVQQIKKKLLSIQQGISRRYMRVSLSMFKQSYDESNLQQVYENHALLVDDVQRYRLSLYAIKQRQSIGLWKKFLKKWKHNSGKPGKSFKKVQKYAQSHRPNKQFDHNRWKRIIEANNIQELYIKNNKNKFKGQVFFSSIVSKQINKSQYLILNITQDGLWQRRAIGSHTQVTNIINLFALSQQPYSKQLKMGYDQYLNTGVISHVNKLIVHQIQRLYMISARLSIKSKQQIHILVINIIQKFITNLFKISPINLQYSQENEKQIKQHHVPMQISQQYNRINDRIRQILLSVTSAYYAPLSPLNYIRQYAQTRTTTPRQINILFNQFLQKQDMFKRIVYRSRIAQLQKFNTQFKQINVLIEPVKPIMLANVFDDQLIQFNYDYNHTLHINFSIFSQYKQFQIKIKSPKSQTIHKIDKIQINTTQTNVYKSYESYGKFINEASKQMAYSVLINYYTSKKNDAKKHIYDMSKQQLQQLKKKKRKNRGWWAFFGSKQEQSSSSSSGQDDEDKESKQTKLKEAQKKAQQQQQPHDAPPGYMQSAAIVLYSCLSKLSKIRYVIPVLAQITTGTASAMYIVKTIIDQVSNFSSNITSRIVDIAKKVPFKDKKAKQAIQLLRVASSSSHLFANHIQQPLILKTLDYMKNHISNFLPAILKYLAISQLAHFNIFSFNTSQLEGIQTEIVKDMALNLHNQVNYSNQQLQQLSRHQTQHIQMQMMTQDIKQRSDIQEKMEQQPQIQQPIQDFQSAMIEYDLIDTKWAREKVFVNSWEQMPSDWRVVTNLSIGLTQHIYGYRLLQRRFSISQTDKMIALLFQLPKSQRPKQLLP